MLHPRIQLNDGNAIPQLGLGTWQIPAAATAGSVIGAIGLGYRLIDTAQGYNNEEGVGEAVRRSEVPRRELFITSKLRNSAHARDAALRAFDETMRKLQLDRLDLFLIHWPLPHQDLYVEAWRTLVELREQGRIRSIGVSNFNLGHLERIIGETGVVPVLNQIELHPMFQQRDKRRFHADHGIAIQSWSSLGSGRAITDPVIASIARKHGRSPAQVMIRWQIQEGIIVIPKTTRPARLAENLDVFDFALDQDDIGLITELDDPDHGRGGFDPATATFLF